MEPSDVRCLASRLTKGLLDVLDSNPEISDVNCKVGEPLDKLTLTSWEQRYACVLPADLKNFYLTCNGFSLRWSYKQQGSRCGIPMGDITIHAIENLKRLAGLRQSASDFPTLLDIESEDNVEPISGLPLPRFNLKCKIFELSPPYEHGRVCLVYPVRPDSGQDHTDPHIWFLDNSLRWHLLATTFTCYLRLLVTHLGLPYWHLAFTEDGLPPVAQDVFQQFESIHGLKLENLVREEKKDKTEVNKLNMSAVLNDISSRIS